MGFRELFQSTDYDGGNIIGGEVCCPHCDKFLSFRLTVHIMTWYDREGDKWNWTEEIYCWHCMKDFEIKSEFTMEVQIA